MTSEGVEYATWLDGEPRHVPWRDLRHMKVECGRGGHGNFRLSFTLGVPSGHSVYRIMFGEAFLPLRKFRRDGELKITPLTNDWMKKPVAREGVAVERSDRAGYMQSIAEGLNVLPIYGPLAKMLGVGRR